MKKDTSSLKRAWGPFKFVRTIIHNIFNYLTCNEYDPSDNRRLLRNLYNAGHIDEGKYDHFRERCSNDNFDPEEIHEA
jgi:hypothetical protein